MSIFVNSSVDGGWSDWGSYGSCTVTCGNGTSTRSRTCKNPVPAAGGKACQGMHTDVRICNNKPCPG